MKIGDDNCSMEAIAPDEDEEEYDFPQEQFEVILHQYQCKTNSFQIILQDYLIESMVYEGQNQLGDQDRYALTPVHKMLKINMNQLICNSWIEFIVVCDKTIDNPQGNASMWLQTAHIYMAETNSYPIDMELVDEDYRYQVQFVIVKVDDMFYFNNLGITSFN